MPLTSPFTRIAFAPADPPGGGDAPGGPRVQRPLVPGIPSRRVDPSGVVTQQTRHLRPHQQQQADRQTIAEEGELVVGQGIAIKGGIRNCRRLVVHGTVEATVPAEALEVGPEGRVAGRFEGAEATVAGRFDGDLIVDGPLTVAPGGVITGRVRYRTLAVESGGHLRAEIDHIDTAPLPAAEAPAAEAPAAPAAETPPADPQTVENQTAEPQATKTPAGETAPAEAETHRETPAEAHTPAPETHPAAEADDARMDTAADGADPAPAAAPDGDGAAERGGSREAPGVPPAFSGLADLTAAPGTAEAARDTAGRDTARHDTVGHDTADSARTDDSDLDDADQDAERFYRSLARTSARV